MPTQPILSSVPDDHRSQSHLLERVRLLAEIDDAARRLLSPEEIVLLSARLLGEFLDVDRCAFADVEADEDTFNVTGNYLRDMPSIVGRYAFHDFSLECLRCMRAGEPYVVYDAEEDWSTQPVLESFRAMQIGAVICVSVKRSGVFTAAMAVHSKEPRVWRADDVALVQAVANRVWESIIRIRTDKQAIEARQVLNLALEAGHAGVFDWVIPENKITWSPQLEALYGVPTGTFEGGFDDWRKRLLPEDAAMATEQFERAMATGQEEIGYDFRAVLPDGSQRWLHGQARFEYTPDGKPLRMIGINVDIQERRQTELALLQTEKLAAVGRLAASIAHEINNPLESVTNLLYLSQHSTDIAEIQGYLKLAEQELARVSVISAQTLRFYKQSTGPRLVTAEELFESVISVLQGRMFKQGVQLHQRWRSGTPVRCLDGEIRQVLANLVTNAIDALPAAGGRLLLRSHEGQDGRGRKGMYIVVADTGSGMPADVQKRLYEAFFTTKGEDGNGLGMWVSKEIVDRHEATLRVRSSQRPERSGTVFRLFLPFDSPVA